MAEQKFQIPPLSETLAKKFRALKQKKYREREQAFLAEGLRLCEDAFLANAVILHVVVTAEAWLNPRAVQLLENFHSHNVPIHCADFRLFSSISDEKSPQGILCVTQKKDPPKIDNIDAPLVLACDNLQDPGNLGTILRSAEWFGVQDVVLNPGCVEAYNPKVVRGSMGAIFRLRCYEKAELVPLISQLKAKGYRTCGALLHAAVTLPEVTATGQDILLVGNEANGMSAELLPLIDMPISIPGRGNGDSLNAAIAASIFLYHFSRH